MDGYLRQSTASQSRLLGPFIDVTDNETALTGLTIANTDIKLRANGTTLSNKNSGGGTHEVNGMYSVTWDATDTANIGELKYSVKSSGAFQVFGSYVVLEEAVYDAMFASSAPGYVANAPVNAVQISGSSDTADKLELTLTNSRTGTVDDTGFSPTTTVFEASDVTEATADHYNGRVILWTSGAVAEAAAFITDYSLVGGRGHFTVSTMAEPAPNGATFIII